MGTKDKFIGFCGWYKQSIDTIFVDEVLCSFDEYKRECDKPSKTMIIGGLIKKYEDSELKEKNANEDVASCSKSVDQPTEYINISEEDIKSAEKHQEHNGFI